MLDSRPLHSILVISLSTHTIQMSFTADVVSEILSTTTPGGAANTARCNAAQVHPTSSWGPFNSHRSVPTSTPSTLLNSFKTAQIHSTDTSYPFVQRIPMPSSLQDRTIIAPLSCCKCCCRLQYADRVDTILNLRIGMLTRSISFSIYALENLFSPLPVTTSFGGMGAWHASSSPSECVLTAQWVPSINELWVATLFYGDVSEIALEILYL